MTTWEAFFLGIVQGLTEFLPISSSGHLELAQIFLGFQNLQGYLLFNLVCHLGTLCAIFCIFFLQIKESFTTNYKQLLKIILGTLPLFPLVLILKPLKTVIDQPQYLGFCFLLSSVLLFLGVYGRFSLPVSSKRRWTDPLTIGFFQALAVLPGVSRSGSTISAAYMLGWKREDAVSFSFLLAIPAILGGVVLELGQVFLHPSKVIPITWPQFAIGFSTSFIIGIFALWLVVRVITAQRWVYFAWYCLFIGILTTFYFNLA